MKNLVQEGEGLCHQNWTTGQSVPVPLSGQTQDDVIKKWVGDRSFPVVSVICHTYNHESFIASAIDGFLIQETDFPFEIIIHDDASTDETKAIIKDYQNRFPDIIKPIFQSVNQYSKGNRPLKFSLPKAKGEFIALCEGDDYWISTGKLQAQVDALRNNEEAVICFHNAIRVSEEGEFISMMNPCSVPRISQTEMMASPFIPTLTRMFRNYGYPWAELPNAPIANDICLTAYLAQFGGAIYLQDRVLSVYRHHDSGVWSQKSKYEKARITVDARLFIAAQLHDSSVDLVHVDSQIGCSIEHLINLVGFFDLIKVVGGYYRKKVGAFIKGRVLGRAMCWLKNYGK